MKARFTQADIQRAIKPAVDLGLPVLGYEITKDGTIVVHTASAAESDADAALGAWERGHGTS